MSFAAFQSKKSCHTAEFKTKKIESHRLSLPILAESELNFSPKFEKFNSFAPGRVVGEVKRVQQICESMCMDCGAQGGSPTKLKSEAAATPATPP